MFVSAKHQYTDLATDFSLQVIDTDFEELIPNLPIRKINQGQDGWSFDVITPLVKCYERRNLNVAANMVIWLMQHRNITRTLDLDLIIMGHPVLEPYRRDIEKYLALT